MPRRKSLGTSQQQFSLTEDHFDLLKEIRVDKGLPNNSRALRFILEHYEFILNEHEKLFLIREGLVKTVKMYVEQNNQLKEQLKELTSIEPLCNEKASSQIEESDND